VYWQPGLEHDTGGGAMLGLGPIFTIHYFVQGNNLIHRREHQGCSLEIRGRLSEAFAIGNVLKDIFTKVSNEEHNEHDNKLITSIVEV